MELSAKDKFIKLISDPNKLTMFRIVASPVIVIFMLYPIQICTFMAALFFSIAAITDYFDGFIARRDGLVSNFGKAMDPLADKLLISSPLIMLTSHGWVPAWMVCIIIGRELAITGLRTLLVEKGQDIAASNLGKYKTGFQIAAIIPLLLHYEYFTLDMQAIGAVMLWFALFFTVWSGWDYFNRFRKLLYG